MPLTTISGLTVWSDTPTPCDTLVVLLHGYGAPGDDLQGLAPCFAKPGVGVLVPEALHELPGSGGQARAWWHITTRDMERIGLFPTDAPPGLAEARRAVLGLIEEAMAQHQARRVGLVGFSQGAMLAMDVAMQLPQPPVALACLSGTLVNATAWRKRYARLADVPVLISHGRRDELLPFAMAEQLVEELTVADVNVQWVPFSGGHEIPASVERALRELM